MNRLEQIKNDYNKFVTSEQYGTLLPLGDNPLESIEYLLRIAEASHNHMLTCMKLYDKNSDGLSFDDAENTLLELKKALEGGEDER